MEHMKLFIYVSILEFMGTLKRMVHMYYDLWDYFTKLDKDLLKMQCIIYTAVSLSLYTVHILNMTTFFLRVPIDVIKETH